MPPTLASQLSQALGQVVDAAPESPAPDNWTRVAETMAWATQHAREAMFPNLFATVAMKRQFAFLLNYLTTCPDVEAALFAFVRFCEAFWSPVGSVWIETHDERAYVVSVTNCSDQDKVFLHDLRSCAIMLGALDWLTGGTLKDLRAQSASRPSFGADWLTHVFPYDMRSGAAFTAYSVRNEDLKRPIVRTAAEVEPFVERLSTIALRGNRARLTDRDLIRSVIEHEVRTNQRIATLEWVCGRLKVSPATLRRRLAEEHVSYRELRDGVLNDLACDLLSDPACTIARVAERLGFSEETSFRRAFRRLNGCTPSDFRTHAGAARTEKAYA